MIEYDFILSASADMRRRIETLIRASKDGVEVAHLYRAKNSAFEIERVVRWARECHDHPLTEVPS